MRLEKISALFAAADEEIYKDSDDTGVLPGHEVKRLKAELKEAKTGLRLAKKEREKGDWFAYQAVIRELENRFARHIALEEEARQLESDLRTIESKREE